MGVEPIGARAGRRARALRTAFALFASLHWLLAGAASPLLEPEKEAERAYAEAMQAIKAEQWGQAELLLERALMLNPEHAGARLELAGLLSARRRAEAAVALIQSLIDDPRTPEPHRARLRAMLARTEQAEGIAPEPPEPKVDVFGEVFAGWLKNPLARADLRELTLTLPGGSITLPVDISPQASGVLGLAVRRTVRDSWSLEATAQRLTGGDSGEAYRVAASGRLPLSGLGQRVQALWFAQTQRAFVGTDRHAAGISFTGEVWGLAGGAFDEPDVGRRGAFFRLDRLTQPRTDLLVVSYLEGEYAASGPPSFVRAGLTAAWTPSPGWAYYAQADLVRDLAGYSPLLDNGARRQTESLYLSAERAWQPAGQSWQLIARAFVGRRWSNLELFGYSDAGLQLSVRQRW